MSTLGMLPKLWHHASFPEMTYFAQQYKSANIHPANNIQPESQPQRLNFTKLGQLGSRFFARQKLTSFAGQHARELQSKLLQGLHGGLYRGVQQDIVGLVEEDTRSLD